MFAYLISNLFVPKKSQLFSSFLEATGRNTFWFMTFMEQ